MSGSYIPYGGSPTQYGQGPEHLFFPPSWGTPAATLANPQSTPIEGALATLGNPEGDSLSDPSPSVPSPDQSVNAVLGSFRNAGAVMGPQAMLSMPIALALSRARGVEPSLSLSGQIGGLLGIPSLGELFSRAYDSIVGPPTATTIEVNRNAPNALAFTTPEVTDTLMADRPGLMNVAQPMGLVTQESLPDLPGPGVDYGAPAEGGVDPGNADKGNKAGGLIKLAGGGPVPQGALVQLAGGGKVAMGIGGGLDDLIPTTINGRRAANLSDGEFVVPADVVSMMGDGSSAAGSRRLYDMMKTIRQQKTGNATQAGPLQIGDTLRRIFK